MASAEPVAEYRSMALKYLRDSSTELGNRDFRQASEKLWGAATQAVMAVALRREWEYASHRAMQNAVKKLAAETGDDSLQAGFLAAELFHKNFYHGGMEYYEMTNYVVLVNDLVERMLKLSEKKAGPIT